MGNGEKSKGVPKKFKLLSDQKFEQVLIPNEPYTPIIEEISIDYQAVANEERIELIHLYPFEQSHLVLPSILDQTLVYNFTDQGTLLIGLQNFQPGSNLNLLFQLAEATANTESMAADISWYYLKQNSWINLRDGFHLLNDATQGLTRSGIVSLVVPNDASAKGSTILPGISPEVPGPITWIRVSAKSNVETVCETIALHPQANIATRLLKPENDTSSLDQGLAAGTISKLKFPDARVKSVSQPYKGRNGRPAEKSISLPYYRRVSEQLRHKGRGIGIFDYEHQLLERFPEIQTAKCITHTLGLSTFSYERDAEWAPGFVTVAVIPNLNRLSTNNMIAPKVPLSLLKTMEEYLKSRISPFANLRIMNPRYEEVKIEVGVIFLAGQGGPFYQNLLQEELRQHLAPWLQGDVRSLSFARIVSSSEIIQFIEKREYVSHITSFTITQQAASFRRKTNFFRDSRITFRDIVGLTARSILTSGEIIVTETQ